MLLALLLGLIATTFAQTCTGTQTFQNTSETFSSSSGNCNFVISPRSPDSVTTITFTEFFLTDGEVVELLFNEVSNTNLTGQLVPGMITAPKGATVRVHFTPAAANTTSGFSAIFRIYGCFGYVELTSDTGSISDGSGDNSNYQDLSDCTWLIRGVQGRKVIVTFQSFATENRYDKVTVYDGNSNTTTPIAILSGTTIPGQIVGSEGQDILVTFVSDDSINDAGWSATFEHSENFTEPSTTGQVSGTTQDTPVTTGVVVNLPPRTSSCKTYTSRNVPLRIPPGNETSGTTESTITILDSFTISQVEIIDVNGTHDYMGDLKLYLVAPNGQNVLIADRSCGEAKTFLFSFSDYATSDSWSCPPDGGEWLPESPLVVLSGSKSDGVWRLQAVDVSEQDIGELNGWKLRLCSPGVSDEDESAISSSPLIFTASALLFGAVCLL